MTSKIRINLFIAFALCLVASALTLAACSQKVHTHTYGEWNETAATCEEAGERSRACLECDYVQTETIEKLGHDWDDGTVSLKSTCENDGVMTYVCKRDREHFYTEPIPSTGHNWQPVQVKISPTCETPGLQSATCANCDATQEEQVIPALEHDWEVVKTKDATCQHGAEYAYTCKRVACKQEKTVTTNPVDHIWESPVRVEPDCERDGSITYSCSFGCNEKKVEKIDRLNHLWGSEYVVDQQPSYTENGVKSKHCTRIGCDARTDIQPIPKLDANTKIDYVVTITDPCGEKYSGSAKIEFYSEGEMVSSVAMATSGVTMLTLLPKEYKIRISGLSEGYSTSEMEYDISAIAPKLTISLKATLLEQTSASVRYELGSILHDYQFNYYDSNGIFQNTSIGEILARKKGILLNFYFTGCSPCRSEMSALVSASKKNPDVQVLMINYRNYGDTDSSIKSFQNTYAADSPLWFMCVTPSTTVFNRFSNIVGAFPTSIWIDSNGQVVYRYTGSLSETSFNAYIKNYILDRYDKLYPDSEASQFTFKQYEVVLPSKKQLEV